jgi:hypothetical protein
MVARSAGESADGCREAVGKGLRMATLHTSQRDLPQMVADTIAHLRDGYPFLAGEIEDAIALLDAGETERARAVLAEALRVMDRELVNH